MKIIVRIPIVLALVLITNSCGSSPAEAPVVKPPLPAPASQDAPPFSERRVSPNQTGFPMATRVAGRPGYVFNPYNQNMVDVKGLKSGTKVRDPEDTDLSHVFVVP